MFINWMYSVECRACTTNTRFAIPCYTDCACAALNKLAMCYPPLNAVVLYACLGELAMFLACSMLLCAVPVLQRLACSLHAMLLCAALRCPCTAALGWFARLFAWRSATDARTDRMSCRNCRRTDAVLSALDLRCRRRRRSRVGAVVS